MILNRNIVFGGIKFVEKDVNEGTCEGRKIKYSIVCVSIILSMHANWLMYLKIEYIDMYGILFQEEHI